MKVGPGSRGRLRAAQIFAESGGAQGGARPRRVGRFPPKVWRRAGSRAGAPGGMLGAVDAVMPAFELVDDRHAVYRETSALSLIADNAWNAGIVLGSPRDPRAVPDLDKLIGSLAIGDQRFEGRSDRPLEALAWIADLTAKLGPGLRRGMIVMTGSLIPTKPIAAGQSAVFEVAGLG